MQFQINEHAILTAKDGDFYLTNRRVSLRSKEWGYSSKIYLYLEDISSIKTVYKSSLILMALTALFGLAFLVTLVNVEKAGQEPIMSTAALTIIAFLLWLASKHRIVSLHPNGGKALEFNTKGLSEEQIYDMLEVIQTAKTERINEMYKNFTEQMQ